MGGCEAPTDGLVDRVSATAERCRERWDPPPNLRRTDEYAEDQNRYETDHAVEADLTEVLVSAGYCHYGR